MAGPRTLPDLHRQIETGDFDESSEQVIAAPEFGTDLPQLIGAIESRGWADTSHGDLVQIELPAASSADVGRAANEAGVPLRPLTPQQDNLEDIFLRLLGNEPTPSSLRAEANNEQVERHHDCHPPNQDN